MIMSFSLTTVVTLGSTETAGCPFRGNVAAGRRRR
jgi:hypothetical protein